MSATPCEIAPKLAETSAVDSIANGGDDNASNGSNSFDGYDPHFVVVPQFDETGSASQGRGAGCYRRIDCLFVKRRKES
ncbi:MAG: hypothetical protein IJM30_01070 [Thermoguttaceae bacterium]|nr:hypothetical protein [Thermoguttaceae bacterium]